MAVEGFSVNGGIREELCTLTYVSVDDAARAVVGILFFTKTISIVTNLFSGLLQIVFGIVLGSMYYELKLILKRH